MRAILRRLAALLLPLLLAGCAASPTQQPSQGDQQYTVTYLDVFDTVTTIKGYAASEADFAQLVQPIHEQLLTYHQLFDIYNEYDGMTNLKTVNDSAGTGPVAVDGAIIQLLLDCQDFFYATSGRVNVAMGGVLALWHEQRSAALEDPDSAALPDTAALEQAAQHADISAVVLDEAAATVTITDPAVQLDVGAVAKGWAAQRAAETAPEGLLISVGGNICATGGKGESGEPWAVGVQDPADAESLLCGIRVTKGSVVTSGDYQRTYEVDGVSYHHIIDPDTLYPGQYWRGVTVVCADSGAADALSTALFLLPQEEGQALLEQYDAQALWVDSSGSVFYSPGFEALLVE